MSNYDDIGAFLIHLGEILSEEHKSREDIQEEIKELGLYSVYASNQNSPSEIVREVIINIRSDIKSYVDDVRLNLTASGVRGSLEEYNSRDKFTPLLDVIPRNEEGSDMDNSFWIGIAILIGGGVTAYTLYRESSKEREGGFDSKVNTEERESSLYQPLKKYYIAFEQNARALRKGEGAKASAAEIALGSDLHWVGAKDEWNQIDSGAGLEKVEGLDQEAQGLHVVAFCVESSTRPPSSAIKLRSFLRDASKVRRIGIYEVQEGTRLSEYGFDQ